jgi:hypothetical protein
VRREFCINPRSASRAIATILPIYDKGRLFTFIQSPSRNRFAAVLLGTRRDRIGR